MYNEKLEQLIDAALADGELTEKEKQILFKNAQEMGVDLDEFEMVLDARLVKFKKEEEEKAKSSAPKSNKLGDVKKCPSCGAIVQTYQGVCGECGYAFENIGANAVVSELSSLLRKANDPQKMIGIIDTYPVPMDKGALIAFITWLRPQSFDFSNPLVESYLKKYDECISKVRLAFSTDKDFLPLIEQYEKDKKDIKRKKLLSITKKLLKNKWFWIGVAILTLSCIIILSEFSDRKNEEMRINERNRCSTAMLKAIKEGNLDKALELYTGYSGGGLLDEVALLLSEYVEKGDIKSAENILKLTGARLYGSPSSYVGGEVTRNEMATQVYMYYIKNKEYDKARKMIECADSDYELWGSHIRDVVVSMCEDGKKKEAKRYLNSYSDKIDDHYDNLGLDSYPTRAGGKTILGDRKYVTEKLMEIINNY